MEWLSIDHQQCNHCVYPAFVLTPLHINLSSYLASVQLSVQLRMPRTTNGPAVQADYGEYQRQPDRSTTRGTPPQSERAQTAPCGARVRHPPAHRRRHVAHNQVQSEFWRNQVHILPETE